MAIRVVRNDAGNCVNFVGTSNPTYWNACLSAEINETNNNNINIINDVRTSTSIEVVYEFFNVPFTDFSDADGNAFADAQAAADYITEKANVLGTDSGINLSTITVGFGLDATSTSIILDNGFEYNVNSIKAIAAGNGLIEIKPILGDRVLFKNLDHTNVTDLDGNAISGGLQDVVNYLNELFTVGAFESVIIADPYSTMVADVDGENSGFTLVGSTAVDPIGDAVFTNGSSGNYAGLKSTQTINQAGEYFTFDIKGEGQIGFGLVHSDDSYNDGLFSGNSSYADPSSFAVGNSAHYGYQFSHWFHPTPNGSWTNYGANTSYSMRSGWSNWDKQQDWLDGNPVKIKVGIDANGYIEIASLADNGADWIVHARTSYPQLEGAEYHLGIKTATAAASVYSEPKIHLLEEAAPTMYFRYIESPDGVFNYPLFATAEEANYYDEITNGLTAGTGQSHTHTYADDPTNTTWYMPEATHDASSYVHSSAPSATTFNGNNVTYTTITSLTNADLTPSAFGATNITQEEGTNVNIQVAPAGASWSTSVSISPSNSGLVFDGYSLVQGTLTDVGSDTTYTITVVRANSYGSSTGSMTVTATDVAPVTTNTTPWTKALDFSGSSEHAKQVSNATRTNPLCMGFTAWTAAAPTTTGYTSNDTNARPWATVVVFKSDRNNSNQHIWNYGDGASSGDDNIYLKLDAQGQLQFNWGRVNAGSLNQCRVATGTQSNTWYAVYIAHNGTRLSSSNATASNLADSFDIRLMSSGDSFSSLGNNLSIASNWTSTGGRMDRAYGGHLTIGGRGSNRNYHGKVASMLVTTLRRNQPMPSTTEIEAMIKDPESWVDDYKVGELYRGSDNNGDTGNFQKNQFLAYQSTQMWLMGDGTSDSYSNGIRNNLYPSDQNYTKLQLNSMVSNDIQTVNINGLT